MSLNVIEQNALTSRNPLSAGLDIGFPGLIIGLGNAFIVSFLAETPDVSSSEAAKSYKSKMLLTINRFIAKDVIVLKALISFAPVLLSSNKTQAQLEAYTKISDWSGTFKPLMLSIFETVSGTTAIEKTAYTSL